MKYFGYDVVPYTPYQIYCGFKSFPHPALAKMPAESLRKMAISLTDTWVKTKEYGSLPSRQISLLDTVDGSSFTSHDPSDSTDGHSGFFEQNYKQIMHNENPDWILCGVSLWYDRLKFQYCDCTVGAAIIDSKYNGTVYIRQNNFPKDIHFVANVPSIDGNQGECYEVCFCCDDWRLSNGSYGSYFSILESVKEDTKKGRRLRFFFENGRHVCRIDE